MEAFSSSTFNNSFEDGIFIQDSCLINLTDNLFVPNAFSPDRNSMNDLFLIQGENIEEIILQIFDHFGKLLFTITEVQQSWDGTYNNQMAEVGVLTYLLRLRFTDNKTLEQKGNITILY